MIKNICKKLKSNNGESIAETLIALLVAALGILLLATMIQTSSSLITSSNKKMREYVDNENNIIEKTVESDTQVGQVSIKDGTETLKFNRSESTTSVDIYYFEMDYGNKTVISFKKKK